MGMAVYGTKPTAEVGECFRRNVWGWRPLADFCTDLAPAITAGCQHWHSNDGDGLDATLAVSLARELRAALDDGRAASYVATRDAELKALPDEPCAICSGTVRPFATHYCLDVSDIAEFAAFLETCGGFEIC